MAGALGTPCPAVTVPSRLKGPCRRRKKPAKGGSGVGPGSESWPHPPFSSLRVFPAGPPPFPLPPPPALHWFLTLIGNLDLPVCVPSPALSPCRPPEHLALMWPLSQFSDPHLTLRFLLSLYLSSAPSHQASPTYPFLPHLLSSPLPVLSASYFTPHLLVYLCILSPDPLEPSITQ